MRKALFAGLFLYSDMDVFVKSFNRPYYLERCLRSIYWQIKGDFRITILDDGTPSRYLERIRKEFPSIIFKRSDGSEMKSAAIEQHLAGQQSYNIKTIPVKLWQRAIDAGSEKFLLLEEDAWLTQPSHINDYQVIMNQHKIAILKLYWSGNPKIVEGSKHVLASDVEQISPQFTAFDQAMTKLVMEQTFLRKILMKFGIISPNDLLPYYTLYTVSSAIFEKNFWLSLWKDASEVVNEHEQLTRALKWKQNHPEDVFAKSTTQKVNTSYITSSLNPFKSPSIDFISLNHFLNEAWYAGKVNPMQNYPHDFSLTYLEQFVPLDLHKIWHDWIHVFKRQFTDQGCIIE
ncbi:MAG TPA: glycosyltransferase [Chryseosolibacter sp.]|nr:glycosyltransferase [Chryseosolibacter sp.]